MFGYRHHAYYKTCEKCGANLDPGEVCEDCKKEMMQQCGDNDYKTVPQQQEENSNVSRSYKQ